MNRRDVVAGAALVAAPALPAAQPPAGPPPLWPVETRTGPRRSTLYVPAGRHQAPAILLLHGSEGGNSRFTHAMAVFFAAAGFVAAPFPYSRGGNIYHAGDIHDIELAETAEALGLMRGVEGVAGPVGLWGISRGAEHALLLTSFLAAEGRADLPGAVAVHAPSDVVVPAFVASDFLPGRQQARPDLSRHAWRWRGSTDGLEPGTPIAIERYAGPLFLSHGEADLVWPVERTRRLDARLRAAGRDPEVHLYPGEGHGLRPEAENINRARTIAFFRRHLGAG